MIWNNSEKSGLSKRVLQVWFQNARAKYRRTVCNRQAQDLSPETNDPELFDDKTGFYINSLRPRKAISKLSINETYTSPGLWTNVNIFQLEFNSIYPDWKYIHEVKVRLL